MQGLKDNYSLHVVIATVLASTMILMSSNGVADAKKTTEDAPSTGLLKQPPAPPGLFGQQGSYSIKDLKPKQQVERPVPSMKIPVAPKAPDMPNLKQAQIAPPAGISAPVMLKPAVKGITQKVRIKEPVFSQAMPTIKTPVSRVRPVAPIRPQLKHLNKIASSVAMPVIGTGVPQFNHNIPPQHNMPQFTAYPNQQRTPPQIQQFRYIPLPVYQANYGQPQPPSFNRNVPGYWVPQINSK